MAEKVQQQETQQENDKKDKVEENEFENPISNEQGDKQIINDGKVISFNIL